MADIKITVKNNNKKTGNYLGYAGEFSRNDGVIRPIAKVSELRKYYGEWGADQAVAEELLTQGVPLLINPVLNSTDTVSTIGFGGITLTEAINSVTAKNIEVPVFSAIVNDGTTEAEEIYDDFTGGWDLFTVEFSSRNSDTQLSFLIADSDKPTSLTAGSRFQIVPGITYLAPLSGVTLKVISTVSQSYNGTPYLKIVATSSSPGISFNTLLPNMGTALNPCSTNTKYMDLRTYYYTFEITGGASLADNMLVGEVVHIEDSVITANNNKNLVISKLTVASSNLFVKCTSNFTLSSDTNATNVGKLMYFDQNIPNTITLDGDYTSIITPNMFISLSDTNGLATALNVVSVTLTSGDTVITVNTPFGNYVGATLQIPVISTGNLILQFDAAPSYSINVGGNYGLYNSAATPTVVTPVKVLSSFILAGKYYYEVNTTYNANFNTVLIGENVGGHVVTTRTTGDNTDLVLVVSKTSNGHLIAIQDIYGVNLESWLLYDGFDAEDVANLNSGMSLITVALNTATTLPTYFSGTFGGSHGAVTEADKLAAITAFTNIPVPALYGKPQYGADVYVQNFPKTIFMEIPAEYTWQQLSAIAASYNNALGRNIHLSYGKFNDVALNTYAIKAFFDTKLNGDALTQTKYSKLGRLENGKINTVLTPAKIKEAEELGVVTMFSVNDSFSDYHLVNNTSPYRKAPLNRANTNFILNKLIWDVINVEFINRDKVLNMDLMREINLQFKQILSNFETYFSSYKILDDSNANNLDELVYNTKQDVLNGTYKVIVELTFFNTLKKLSVEFVVS